MRYTELVITIETQFALDQETVMITERFQTIVDTVKQLPPAQQDQIAAAVESLLKETAQLQPTMSEDVRAEYERVLPSLKATLAYLKDK